VSVSILNLGCITQDWRVPLGDQIVPVVLGYDNPVNYLTDQQFMGQIVGPVANRIAGASFELEGVQHHLDINDPPHHLHGGATGLGRQLWEMEPDGSRAVELRLTSSHGTGGYPGLVAFRVRISLDGHRLTYDMWADTDRPTPINLAQHNYYTLGWRGKVGAHLLWINADHYLPTGPDLIPTGQIAPVAGTALDFRRFRHLSDTIQTGPGLDSSLVLNPTDARPMVKVHARNGMQLRLWTDQPGLQLFTGQNLQPGARAHSGQEHLPFSGFCLEPQAFPDSPNQPGFPTVVITPVHPYHQTLSVEIKEENTE
jgi:aldose 1-epimerase